MPFELEKVGGLKEVWAELTEVEQTTRVMIAHASATRFLLIIGPPEATTITYDAVSEMVGLWLQKIINQQFLDDRHLTGCLCCHCDRMSIS